MSDWATCLAELKELCWRGADITDAVADDHLFQAQQYIQKKRKWNWLDEIKELSSDNEQVDVPVDLGEVIVLECSDDNVSFWALNHQPLGKADITYDPSETGAPDWYSRMKDKFFLRPRPDKTYYFRCHYRKLLPRISGTQSNTLTTDYKMPLLYRAAYTLTAGPLADGDMAQRFSTLSVDELMAMEDDDDTKGRDLASGMIEPDNTYDVMARGTWR